MDRVGQPSKFYPEFSKRLSEHLTAKERSATWLAERLGINPSTVNRWLNHDTRPRDLETVARIADLLGIHEATERSALFAAAGYVYQAPSAPDPTLAAPVAEPAPDNSNRPPKGDTPVASSGSVKIQGDVITGGTVNQANFHGQVTGPVHTGSGNIYMNPPPSAQIFTNVWYLAKEYHWWQWRNPDVGTLELQPQQVQFRGRSHAVQMSQIQSITHGHQPGDLNNNWVKVSYLDEKGHARLAFFADAKKLGIGNLVGGSDAIFQALHAWQAAPGTAASSTMNQNDFPFNAEPEEQKNVSDERSDHNDGSNAEGRPVTNIDGDLTTGGTVNKAIFHGPVIGPVHAGSGDINYIDMAALLRSYRRWLHNTLDLANIPPHLNTSWAGRAIYVMRQVADGLSAQQWWTFITTFTLWVATVWLVTPILQWPLADALSRGRACLLYAIATLVLPFFVALTAPVDRQDEMVLDTPLAKRRFWFLKITGAYTGFALAAGTIAVALLAYYLGWTLPRGMQWLLALVPLFFSHIAARRIPGDRLKMFGEVRLHEVDRLVIVVFLLLGPGVAAFVYWGYTAIANPGMGLLLLITLSGLALWEVRQRQRGAFADWALIGVFGLLLPLAFMLFVFYFTTPGPLPSTGAWWALAVVTPYFLGLTLLVATIFVRNPPILTIRGMLGLLAVILLLAYLTSLNRWLGSGLLVAVVLFWVLWGRRIWRQYFWVHASFGGMLIVLIGSVYLWVQADTPHWIALVGFFVATGLLLGWAYQPVIKASLDAVDDH